MIEKPLFMLMDVSYAMSNVVPTEVPPDFPDVPRPLKVAARHIGVEIEVERCGRTIFNDYAGMAHHWIIEKDPSLRGDDAYELKTRFPKTLAEVFGGLTVFDAMMKGARLVYKAPELFDFSERTSIHVHVDVRSLTYAEIKSVVKLYMLFEKSFFDLIGRNRYHNIFCIPVSESNLIDHKRGRDFIRGWDKYCALNLATCHQYGTVEFRGMAGTDDVKAIKAWVLLCACLVDYASCHSPQEINDTISRLKWESQYMELAREIFGEQLASLLHIFPEASDQAATLTKFI